MSNVSNSEIEFFNLDKVTVTSARFVVSDKTYVMSNVTSVSYSHQKPSSDGAFMMIMVGAFFILLIIAAVVDGKMTGTAFLVMTLMGLFFLSMGINSYKNLKMKYSVVLQTSSGAVQALESTDQGYIQSVVEALNNAIIHRG